MKFVAAIVAAALTATAVAFGPDISCNDPSSTIDKVIDEVCKGDIECAGSVSNCIYAMKPPFDVCELGDKCNWVLDNINNADRSEGVVGAVTFVQRQKIKCVVKEVYKEMGIEYMEGNASGNIINYIKAKAEFDPRLSGQVQQALTNALMGGQCIAPPPGAHHLVQKRFKRCLLDVCVQVMPSYYQL